MTKDECKMSTAVKKAFSYGFFNSYEMLSRKIPQISVIFDAYYFPSIDGFCISKKYGFW